MRTIISLLLASWFFIPAFSQENTALERLYLSEQRAAKSLINFQTNSNTGNYDVKHYKLEFTVDPSVAYIEGTVSTTFLTKSLMNTMIFDFDDQMTVNQVTMNGNNLVFTQNTNDELVIQFTSSIAANQLATVVIDYEGNPISSGFGSFEQSYHNGAPIIWTLSEPYGAKAWWPCKQDLNDKADSLDVFVTAPAIYTAVSNGLNVGETTSGTLKTTHWDHNYPIPAYLVAFAVSNYVKYSHMAGSGANTFPIDNYVYPEDLTFLQTKTPVTVTIMDFFESTFGTYPYSDEKYGHCQFGWGGGMEHATISFMGSFGRGLIAHELAHQWFGDKITCGSWQDIWLNEGFATYLAGMVIEDIDGQTAFNSWKASEINEIVSQPDGSVYVPAQDTLSVGRVFNSRLSYSKGGMVLHMLRKKLGDPTFFLALQNYLSDPFLAYGYAKTPDLKGHLESTSGLNLNEFFQDWVYGQGYPSYSVSWHQENNNDVVLTFNQTQSHPSVTFFEAPVNILFVGSNNEMQEVVFNNTTNGEVFTENIPFQVVSVEIDPHADLISKNNTAALNIENVKKSHALTLYPNPVEGKLFVDKSADLQINSYSIYTIHGKKVQGATYFDTGFISTEMLESGTYFVFINTSEGFSIEQILKE